MLKTLRNNRRLLIGVIIVGLVVGLPLLWWLASPLFIDRSVNEAFPFDLPDATAIAAMSAADREQKVAAIMGQLTDEQMAALDAAERQQVEDTLMTLSAGMPDHARDEALPAAAEWQGMAQGQFQDADSFHKGSGRAAILQQGAARVLRLEDFQVTNGPDLHILLVEHIDATSHDDLGAYIDLGALKGNVGNQNYEISADADLSLYGGVMIYCMPFHVVFATAAFGR